MTKREVINNLKSSMIKDLRLEEVTPEDMPEDAPLFAEDGLALDSLDAVELAVIVEKNFGLAIDDAEEARKAFTTLNGLADYILEHKVGM